MSELPRTVNLSKLQSELVKTARLPDLSDKIRRALNAQSCLGDMRQAHDCLSALVKLVGSIRGWKSPERDTTEAALLSSAISLYARATVTQLARRPSGQAPERGPVQIRNELSPELQADHDSVIAIRGQALAHVYFDRELDGVEWHQGAALLIEADDGWLPGAASRRVRLHSPTIEQLSRLLPVGVEILTERVHLRFVELQQALERNKGPALNEAIGRSWLEPIEFFGSEEAAARALGKAKKGTWSVFEE